MDFYHHVINVVIDTWLVCMLLNILLLDDLKIKMSTKSKKYI